LKVGIDGWSANRLELRLRQNEPPIIGRIENDAFLMDARTLQLDEIPIVVSAVNSILTGC
jgi:L-seryl-tRNA(Ser) seleniumtransferase